MGMIFHVCPTCGAQEGAPCRTPKGRIKKTGIHDTRPFSPTLEAALKRYGVEHVLDAFRAIAGEDGAEAFREARRRKEYSA